MKEVYFFIYSAKRKRKGALLKVDGNEVRDGVQMGRKPPARGFGLRYLLVVSLHLHFIGGELGGEDSFQFQSSPPRSL